jgi:flagellar basal-body rod protein FlgB
MTPSVPQANLLSSLMDAAELRHRVLSQNIANVNTPNYRRQDVSFEDTLAAELDSAQELDLEGIAPRVYEEAGAPARADGNTVDIDREIGQLNKNSLLYETYSQVLGSYLDSMRRAMQTR